MESPPTYDAPSKTVTNDTASTAVIQGPERLRATYCIVDRQVSSPPALVLSLSPPPCFALGRRAQRWRLDEPTLADGAVAPRRRQ
jgi:hypothetical protein